MFWAFQSCSGKLVDSTHVGIGWRYDFAEHNPKKLNIQKNFKNIFALICTKNSKIFQETASWEVSTLAIPSNPFSRFRPSKSNVGKLIWRVQMKQLCNQRGFGLIYKTNILQYCFSSWNKLLRYKEWMSNHNKCSLIKQTYHYSCFPTLIVNIVCLLVRTCYVCTCVCVHACACVYICFMR